MDLYQRGIRQGALISAADLSSEVRSKIRDWRASVAARKSSSGKIKESDFLIVISQDCDINNANFGYIEVVRAKSVNKLHSALTRLRSTSKLHFEVLEEKLEIESRFISHIDKDDLYEIIDDITNSIEQLPSDFVNSLVAWRAQSYAREAFPDLLNQELKEYRNLPAGAPLNELLDDYHKHIDQILIRTWPEEEGAHHYQITIHLLLKGSCPQSIGESIASLFDLFLESFNHHAEHIQLLQVESEAESIELDGCHSDIILEKVFDPKDMSLADYYSLRVYNFEFASITEEGASNETKPTFVEKLRSIF